MPEPRNTLVFLGESHIFTKSSKQENNEQNMKNRPKIPSNIINKSLKIYPKSIPNPSKIHAKSIQNPSQIHQKSSGTRVAPGMKKVIHWNEMGVVLATIFDQKSKKSPQGSYKPAKKASKK